MKVECAVGTVGMEIQNFYEKRLWTKVKLKNPLH
jgi:hypothetical protein